MMARFPSVVLDLTCWTGCHVISPLDTLAKLSGNFSATGHHSRQPHANDRSISSTNHPKGCKRIIACGLSWVRKYRIELNCSSSLSTSCRRKCKRLPLCRHTTIREGAAVCNALKIHFYNARTLDEGAPCHRRSTLFTAPSPPSWLCVNDP